VNHFQAGGVRQRKVEDYDVDLVLPEHSTRARRRGSVQQAERGAAGNGFSLQPNPDDLRVVGVVFHQ
jgi:hypothetical protein